MLFLQLARRKTCKLISTEEVVAETFSRIEQVFFQFAIPHIFASGWGACEHGARFWILDGFLTWSPTTMKTRRRTRRARRMNFLLRFSRTFFSAWTVSIFSFVTSILIMRAGKKRFWFLQFNGHVTIVTVDMILHPVQLVSPQTDQGRKIHEDPMDLGDLLLHPHHIIVSEEGKGATTNSLSLKKYSSVNFSQF